MAALEADLSSDAGEAPDEDPEEPEAGILDRAVAVRLTQMGPDPGADALFPMHLMRCINGAARWLLSGAKPGSGVEALLNDDVDSYWQSDGKAPHTVQATFDRRTTVTALAILVDREHDESYTPQNISIRAGTAVGSTSVVRDLELTDPTGWVVVPLAAADPDADLTAPPGVRAGDTSRVGRAGSRGEAVCFPQGLLPLRCNVIEVIVRTMHHGGRDTRLRQLRLLGPVLGHDAAPLPAGIRGGGVSGREASSSSAAATGGCAAAAREPRAAPTGRDAEVVAAALKSVTLKAAALARAAASSPARPRRADPPGSLAMPRMR